MIQCFQPRKLKEELIMTQLQFNLDFEKIKAEVMKSDLSNKKLKELPNF